MCIIICIYIYIYICVYIYIICIYVYSGLVHDQRNPYKPTRIQWNERGTLNTAHLMIRGSIIHYITNRILHGFYMK